MTVVQMTVVQIVAVKKLERNEGSVECVWSVASDYKDPCEGEARLYRRDSGRGLGRRTPRLAGGRDRKQKGPAPDVFTE
jgi:hypothetical protein